MQLEESGAQLLRTVERHLDDLDGLLAAIERDWPTSRLTPLLGCRDGRVVRATVRLIGMTGSMTDCVHLVPMLGHRDDAVSGLAENALWSIWMRAGTLEGNRRLAYAVEAVDNEHFGAAVAQLYALTNSEPRFAEAHHQLAIAFTVTGRHDDAAQAYRQTLRLNGFHFAAAAGRGHLYVERGDLAGALRYYRRALTIHPKLTEIAQVVPKLEAALRRSAVL